MTQSTYIDPAHFNRVSEKLRGFFRSEGYIECFPQNVQSIMAACEDPKTITPYIFRGVNYPMVQTNQMHLEMLLLTTKAPGYFCFTTSYRNEPHPIPGRHDLVFPMFEFEHRGDFDDLLRTLDALTVYLGLARKGEGEVHHDTYDSLCMKFGVTNLTAKEEQAMDDKYGHAVCITNFPERTSPFWNMKQQGQDKLTGEKLFNKADYILHGIETFGSAERSTDVEQMRHSFHNISEGEYANLLYHHFGKERVEAELNEYLSLPMFPRFGGGIGVTRLIRALRLQGVI